MLDKAIEIAVQAHKGLKDKSGKPYILHLLRVMNMCESEIEKICGVLHDIVEDTDYTFEMLESDGFSNEIINALRCLTKGNNEDYTTFINRIKTNSLATKVKINDLRDNMDITRLNKIFQADADRLEKYLRAYHFLQS